jgi:hypothetical protein
MVSYIQRCKEEKTGLWASEMRDLMLRESSKDCYVILDENEWKNQDELNECKTISYQTLSYQSDNSLLSISYQFHTTRYALARRGEKFRL